jgi:hypothetical protein
MRRVVVALAIAASWIVLLLWAARVEFASPFFPAATRTMHGMELTPVFGAASKEDAGRLRVTATGDDYTSLQSKRLSDIDAESFTTLRYRFADFPRTLELSLVFRTAESPDDIAISLPWPGEATQTFDLSRIPEWRGRIVELGFAEFPTAQVVPPERGFAPFSIVAADLDSRSWRGDLAALATDWLGAWPWTQRSVHALGRDTDTPRARPLVLIVAIAAMTSVLWIAVVIRRPRTVAIGAVAALALSWVALDAVWQGGLWGRVLTTRAVYGDLSLDAREHTTSDGELAASAEALRARLKGEPADARIIVYADAGRAYDLLRFMWHLLPLNVGVYAYAAVLGPSVFPNGCLIVFLDTDAWRTDPWLRTLLAHSEHLSVKDSIHGDGFEREHVTVFRFRRGG